jgi:hypothetical protein
MRAIKTFLLPCFLWLNLSYLYAQTTLTTGDIAIVGWNAYDDGTNGLTNDDQIAFVLLKDITANTVIYFTDYGWVSTPTARFQVSSPSGCTGGTPPYGAQSDGIMKWTSSSAMTCGTLVWFKSKFLSAAPLASSGTVSGVSPTASTAASTIRQYVGLPTTGDQVFAFQVAAGDVAALSTGVINNPTLLAAMNMRVSWETTMDICSNNANQSTLPAALANASIFIPSANGTDLSARINARFNCSGNTTAAPSVLRGNFSTSSNWTFNQTNSTTGLYNFGAFGCTFTCSASAPDITTQPTAQTTCDTRSASFTIVANNTTGYQWQISTDGGTNYSNLSNAGVYSGVTGTTLSISNATGLDGNFYRCVVSNASFTSNSSGVRLTVNRFVLQPSSMTSCSACPAGFTVSARGLGLTYQWQESISGGAFANLTNSGVYSGINTKTLAISTANGLTGRQYRCVLGGCASPINSNAATLTVSGTAQTTLAAGDIAIVGLNTGDDGVNGLIQDDEILFVLLKDIVAGTEISFSDIAWNSSTQSFLTGTNCSTGIVKWIAPSNMTCGSQIKIKSKYLLEANIGVVLPMASGGSGVYVSMAAADFVFGFQGTTVSPTLLYAFHTNAWAATNTACLGGSSALPTALSAAGLNAALARGASGWTSANYNCANVNNAPSQLRASIASATNWATSTSAISFPICTFACTNGAPQITTQPSNTVTCDGRTASFSITAAGTNTYKWQIFNGSTWDYLANGGVYSNVTTTTLNISNATGLNGKQYRCEVTNAVTSVNSNLATLTVNRFYNQPISMTTCTGCQAAFSVIGLGSGLTYQWQESSNGTTFANITNGGVYSGATANILKISNVTTPTNLNNRQYRVVLGGCTNPINSGNATLTVSATAATTLAAGDITFVGFGMNDDGVNGLTQDDEFAFILLKDINAGTEINFTDFGWRSDVNAFHQSNTTCGTTLGSTGDGILKWIAGSNLTCGTQVSIKCKYSMQTNTGIAYGLQSITSDANAFLSLSTSGEQIFAFTGTYASPTLISGISNKPFDASLTTCEATSTKSVKPAALNGFTIEFATNNDYGAYKCTAPTRNTPSVVRAATQNTANWDVNSITPYTLPLACSFCCAASFTFVSQPTNQSACIGTTATMSVSTNPSNQNFQWQLSAGAGFANISNSSQYSGATSNSLGINTIVASMNNYQYRCVITDVCGSTNSNTATLTVPSINLPSNISPLTSTTVNQPNTVSLSASCTAGNEVVWYNSATGTASIGSGNSLSITPPVAGNYNYFALCRQTASPNCISTGRVATGLINYCGLVVNSLPNYSNLAQTIKSASTISVNNVISNNANVIYQSGGFIELLPGFSVSNSVFKTQSGGCN